MSKAPLSRQKMQHCIGSNHQLILAHFVGISKLGECSTAGTIIKLQEVSGELKGTQGSLGAP
jgi:hypothetical protein